MALKKNKGPLLTSKVRGGESDTMREIPAEFRAALDMTVTEQEVPVDVDADALSDTVLSSKVEQTRMDERKKRTVVKPAGPVTLVEKDTNEKKQVVTRTRKMQDASTAATVPTATKDVQQKNLGIGQTIEEVSEVPEVFSEQTYQKEIPDVVPQRFRVAVPTETTESSSAGTAADPALGTGDLQKSELQVNKFVKRVRSVFRSLVSLPVSLVSKETNREKQVVTVTETLKTAGSDAVPSATQDVDVQNLGDGSVLQTVKAVPGVFDEKTRQIGTPLVIPERFRAAAGVNTKSDVIAGTVPDTVALASGEVEHVEEEVTEFTKRVKKTVFDPLAAPTLHGQELDRRLGIITPYEETLQSSGTSLGDANIEISPLSDQVDLVKEFDFSAIATFAATFLLEMPGQVNIELPVELVSLTASMEKASGSGSYSETGSGFAVEPGGWRLSIPGRGEGSASIIPVVIPVFKHRNGRNMPTTRYVFLLPIPVTTADIITALAGFGVTVSAWPKFSPQPVTIKLVGQELTLQANTSAQEEDSLSGDVGEGYSESSGSGSSRRKGQVIREKELPPTIHGVINVGGTTSDTQSVTASASSTTGGISASESTTDTASAFVSPTSLATTGNTVSVPTTGKYLLPADAEPYLPGYALVHAEVVDFANVG